MLRETTGLKPGLYFIAVAEMSGTCSTIKKYREKNYILPLLFLVSVLLILYHKRFQFFYPFP